MSGPVAPAPPAPPAPPPAGTPPAGDTPPPAPAPDAGSGSWSVIDAILKGADDAPTPAPPPTPPPAPAPAPAPAPPPAPNPKPGDPPAPKPPEGGAGDDDIPNPFTPGSKQHVKWAELRGENKTLKTSVAAAQSTIDELNTRMKGFEKFLAPEEAAKLKEEIAGYETQLLGTRLEATKAYKEAVAAPVATVTALVERLSKTYKLDGDALLNAISEEDETARVEALAKLGATMLDPDRLKFYGAVDTFNAAMAARDDLESRSKEVVTAAQAAEEQARIAAAAAAQQAMNQALEQTAPLLAKKYVLFQDAEVMAAVRKDVEGVNFDDITPATKAVALFAGAALPKIILRDRQQREEIAALKLENEQLRSGQVTPGGGGGGGQDDGTGSFLDRVMKGVSGAGG